MLRSDQETQHMRHDQPTKPTVPLRETTTAVTAVASVSKTIRHHWASTPRVRARCSPHSKISRSR